MMYSDTLSNISNEHTKNALILIEMIRQFDKESLALAPESRVLIRFRAQEQLKSADDFREMAESLREQGL